VDALRRGYLFGLAAYACWGFFPLYWKLLRPAGPVEILAHRIVWSVVFVSVVLAVRGGWRFLGTPARRPRTLAGIALAAGLIAVNWGTYIYGVNSNHVVETSLGYFITPLVTVLLGVFVLRERLRALQWVALGTGAVAVAILTVDYGRLPWIALTLAASFGMYGLVKKSLKLPAAKGLFVESAVLAGPALAYLLWLEAAHHGSFGHVSVVNTALLVLAGTVTAVPLLLFAGAANRIPLSALGLLQYLAPILQLGCGVLVYHEPMPPARLAGFALVWAALAVFTWDGVRSARRRPAARSIPEPEPAAI
jgi:chloramphenicol-sensitive protein RarD